jgi:hypothetical protein
VSAIGSKVIRMTNDPSNVNMTRLWVSCCCLFPSSHPGPLVLLTLRLWKPVSISSTKQRKVL